MSFVGVLLGSLISLLVGAGAGAGAGADWSIGFPLSAPEPATHEKH
jgi:hypothetical protein